MRLLELPFGRLGHEGEQPRIMGVIGEGRGARGDAGLDEVLLEPPDLVLREDAREHRKGGPVGVGRRRHVIGRHQRTDLADAAEDHRPLAVLGRLLGVGGIQPPRRLRDRAEVFRRQFEGLGRLEFPRHDQHDVVGLVEALVKVAEVFDRHPLDVGTIADRRLAVVVPFVGCRLDALREDTLRAVLAALELVADNGELGEEVLPLDEAVDEPIALEVDGEVEVFVTGGEGLEVVRAVDVCRAVEAGAMVAQRLRHLRESRRSLEDKVLEEVGHPCLTVALVARADEHRHVDRDRRSRRVGKEHEPGAVVEGVLRYPFDGGYGFRRRCWERGCKHGDRGDHGKEGGTGEMAEHGVGSCPGGGTASWGE